jgi:hypothetical protein
LKILIYRASRQVLPCRAPFLLFLEGRLIVTRGLGDSKLLCGPTTRIEGKERYDSKGREKARKAQS